jgi:hypothetical protein
MRRLSPDFAIHGQLDADRGRGLLRELGQIRNIDRELVAFVFDWLTGLQRGALVAAEPIDLLAGPNRPL